MWLFPDFVQGIFGAIPRNFRLIYTVNSEWTKVSMLAVQHAGSVP